MEWGSSHGVMDLVIVEVILLAKGKGKENLYLIMVIFIMEVGMMENSKEKGHYMTNKEMFYQQVYGNKEY